MIYLIEKYAQEDTQFLYPEDPQIRAVINQRLYFDIGTLYQKFADYYYPTIFRKEPADPEKFKELEGAVEFLEVFLEGQEYAVGNELTLADIALVTTISNYDAVGFDLSGYPNIQKWFEACKANIPGYEINEAGLEEFKKFLTSETPDIPETPEVEETPEIAENEEIAE